jgi:hypothetical protein
LTEEVPTSRPMIRAPSLILSNLRQNYARSVR